MINFFSCYLLWFIHLCMWLLYIHLFSLDFFYIWIISEGFSTRVFDSFISICDSHVIFLYDSFVFTMILVHDSFFTQLFYLLCGRFICRAFMWSLHDSFIFKHDSFHVICYDSFICACDSYALIYFHMWSILFFVSDSYTWFIILGAILIIHMIDVFTHSVCKRFIYRPHDSFLFKRHAFARRFFFPIFMFFSHVWVHHKDYIQETFFFSGRGRTTWSDPNL